MITNHVHFMFWAAVLEEIKTRRHQTNCMDITPFGGGPEGKRKADMEPATCDKECIARQTPTTNQKYGTIKT